MRYGLGIAESLRAEGAPEPVGYVDLSATEENDERRTRSDSSPDEEDLPSEDQVIVGRDGRGIGSWIDGTKRGAVRVDLDWVRRAVGDIMEMRWALPVKLIN
jgi:hypothetical protein